MTTSVATSDDAALVQGVLREVARRIVGQEYMVERLLISLLTGGHVLLEGVPGLAKTLTVRTLAETVRTSFQRIQFTPDLLPGDVVGVSVFNRETRDFEFKPGAVFANIVLGDEINRASPKTQSALLECMEEGQVTVDGTTYLLGRPFMVLATQNPSEMEGTYALPEAQRDRFMARVHMGYPDRSSEIQMLQAHSADDPLESLAPVTDAAEVRAMIDAVRQVYVAPAIDAYVVDLVSATRQHSHVRLGASPRAALHLLRAARASAALSGRGHVLPDDVQRLAVPVLAHRLVLTTDAHLSRTSAQDVVTEILTRVPLPASA